MYYKASGIKKKTLTRAIFTSLFNDIREIRDWFFACASVLLWFATREGCRFIILYFSWRKSPFSRQNCPETLSFSAVVFAMPGSAVRTLCAFSTCCNSSADNLPSCSMFRLSLLLSWPVVCDLRSKIDFSYCTFICSSKVDTGFTFLLTLRISNGAMSFVIGCLVFITLRTCHGKHFRRLLLSPQPSSHLLAECSIRDYDSGSRKCSPQKVYCGN